jgi:MOSC domain-containing protein YiiM
MDKARLISVNVGLPRDIEWRGRMVHTGIWKSPAPGRCRVRRLNVDGDGQGDLAGHGGEQRAVFVYQIESYRYWQQKLGRSDFVYGQFGENFTVEGLADTTVCIGDRYRIGDALFEVTQPRVTCYRIAIRMDEPRMPALLTSSGRPGFYFRVLEEGDVGAGDEIIKVVGATEPMTVAEVNALLYSGNHPHDRLEQALRIEALSRGWRSSFEALLQQRGGDGNAGLVPQAAAHPSAPGFRRLRVTEIKPESPDVLSLTLQAADGSPLTSAAPGQYVIVRLDAEATGRSLFRSYSISGPAATEQCRISIKREPHGVVGTYLHERLHVNDILDVSSPRGSFILQAGEGPLVLLSAGIGATPARVLGARSPRWSASSVCGGDSGTRAGPCTRAQLRLLQPAPRGRQSRREFRWSRSSVEIRPGRAGYSAASGGLPLRAESLHE